MLPAPLHPGAHLSGQVALSVDLEEYFQVEAMAGVVARADWPTLPARIEGNTERLLAAFAEAGAQATFFVVGWLAERYPALVARIAAAGHELGCHSYWHRPVFGLEVAEFAEDTRRAKAAIEDASGTVVSGYRAPNFSIRSAGPQRMDWALEVLSAAGFAYDSSLHPVRHPLYGAASAPRLPFFLSQFGLWELPLATVAWGRQRLPMAGGGFWRLAPLPYTCWGVAQAQRQGLRPICYLHPWELDPQQPRLPIRGQRRFRHYVGLGSTEGKLRRLLARFGSCTIAGLYAGELHSAAPAVALHA